MKKTLNQCQSEKCNPDTYMWISSNNLLSVQFKNQSEHTVCSWMLRSLKSKCQYVKTINLYKVDSEMSYCRVDHALTARLIRIDFIP